MHIKATDPSRPGLQAQLLQKRSPFVFSVISVPAFPIDRQQPDVSHAWHGIIHWIFVKHLYSVLYQFLPHCYMKQQEAVSLVKVGNHQTWVNIVMLVIKMRTTIQAIKTSNDAYCIPIGRKFAFCCESTTQNIKMSGGHWRPLVPLAPLHICR